VKERIDAHNNLDTSEKDKIGSTVKDTLEWLDWLDGNQIAKKEDYKEKLKEVEDNFNCIIYW
jgi:hypothetical protein